MSFRLAPLVRGDPRRIVVTAVDGDGAPVNLAGSTWSAAVRDRPGSSAVPLAVDTSRAGDGILEVAITGEQSQSFSTKVYGDLEGSALGTLLSFRTFMLSDVTSGDPVPDGGLVDSLTVTISEAGVTELSNFPAVLLPGAEESYLHEQASEHTSWLINHNLGFKPSISVLDNNGYPVVCGVVHHSDLQAEVQFIAPISGTARCS